MHTQRFLVGVVCCISAAAQNLIESDILGQIDSFVSGGKFGSEALKFGRDIQNAIGAVNREQTVAATTRPTQ